VKVRRLAVDLLDRRGKMHGQASIDAVFAFIEIMQLPVDPGVIEAHAEWFLQSAFHRIEVLEGGAEGERDRKVRRLSPVVLEDDEIVEREVATVDDAIPADADGFLFHALAVGGLEIRIGQFKFAHEAGSGRRAQRRRQRPGHTELVRVEKPAIVVVQPISVPSLDRHIAVRLRDEKHIVVLDDDGIRNAARGRRPLLSEKVFFAVLLLLRHRDEERKLSPVAS
jgi:hypothetical protein